MKLIFKYVFVVFLFLLIQTTYSQSSDKYYVEKKLYTHLEGLPGKSVRQITQDKRGFLWIVTNNGLCRFDGKEFKSFTQKSHGLYHNNISYILSDNKKGIIIYYYDDKSKVTITNGKNGHVDVIDIYSLKVKQLTDYYNITQFKEKDVSEIRIHHNKVLFFLSPFFSLHVENYPKATVWEMDSTGVLSQKQIKALYALDFKREGKKLKATVSPYDFSMGFNNNHSAFILNDTSVMCRMNYGVSYIFKINKSNHYLKYTDSLGTSYFKIYDDNKIKQIDTTINDYPKFITDESIQYFSGKLDNIGILFKQKNVLFLYNYKHELITLIDSTDNNTIRSAQIASIFKDKIGNYWIATGSGIVKVTIKNKKFYHLFTKQQIPFGLNNSTRGFARVGEDLFVATYDFIGIKNRTSTQILKNYYNFAFCKTNSSFWVAANSLQTFDIKSKKTNNVFGAPMREVWTMYPLLQNKLLMGTTLGIGVFDIQQKTMSYIDTGNFSKPNITYKFFEYNKNIVAVSSNGIFVLDKNGKIIDCYNKNQIDSLKKINVEEINDVYIDKEGLYWIATAFDGLYCWNRTERKIFNYGIENGFLSTTLYRIEEDDYKNLWISTDFGIAKFNKFTKRAKIYTIHDGISDNEFNRASSFKDSDGTLYFGGMNGVTFFHPKNFFNDDAVQSFPFIINHLSVYNTSTNLLENIEENYFETKKVILKENYKNLSIDVALLDMVDRVHTYAYQIVGLDNAWSYLTDGKIKINNLPYGNFTLKIKAQCVNGMWNKIELSIPIIVLKPFYATWWFIILTVVFFIFCIYLFFKQRTIRLEKQNTALEHIVNERTSELKASLSEQIILLQELHHRVKNNLQFIAAMLKMQINSIKDEGNKAVLYETSRRINSMSLVHEMLYKKDKLEYVSTEEYLTELISKLKDVVYDNNAPIQYNLNIDDIKFNVNDCVAIGMVTSEIISNSIKHAFSSVSNPNIDISLQFNKSSNCVTYKIKDNGTGINNELNKSGLGMRLIDIFSRQMEAEYEKKNDFGLTYIFKIPHDEK